jgi:C4-dicarboxylate-specific signal transduction histidine kinase
MASIVVPAAAGFAGTVLGALISWTAAAGQRRSEREREFLSESMKLFVALEDLEEEVRARIKKAEEFTARDLTGYSAVRQALQRVGVAAIAAGVDSAYVWEVIGSSLREIRALSPAEEVRRVSTFQELVEHASSLVAAITALPFWRRRGRFMSRDLKQRRKDLEHLSDFWRHLAHH